MFKIVYLVTFLVIFGFSSLLDFQKINNATNLYKQGYYKEALRELKSLNKDTPVINYDIANTLYKLGRYKEALSYYKKALGDGVDEANRIYNIGNCYFKLKEWDKAIFAYEISLKIKDNQDTKYNLDLAYKMKYKPKEEKKKKKSKEGKGKKDKNKDGKKDKSKDKTTNKDKKLTKEELKKLKEMKKRTKLQKRLKKMLNRALKDKEVPVLMYKIDRGTKEQKANNLKPW